MGISVADLDAVLLDMDGTILDTTEELCHAVATAVNRMRDENTIVGNNGSRDNNDEMLLFLLPSLPEMHHTDVLTKHPGLFGGPLEEFHDTILGPHLDYDTSNNEEDRKLLHARSTKLFIKQFWRAVEEQETPCPAFPDVLDALQRLAKKHPSLRFGVATTKPTAVAEADLAASPAVPPELRSLLHHVQGTDKGIRPKPFPDVLLRCAGALGVDVAKTIYIGDTRRDAKAAKAAGCAASLAVVRSSAPPPQANGNNNNDDDDDDDALGADGLIRSFAEIEAVLETIAVLPDDEDKSNKRG